MSQPEHAPLDRSSRAFKIAVLVLILVGGWIYYRLHRLPIENDIRIITPPGEMRMLYWAMAATALGIVLSWTRAAPILDRVLRAVRSPSRPLLIAIALWVISSVYLLHNARRQGVPPDLYVHDENMYMVQAQMLAHGRLWMPQHEHPDFFESFHIIVRPVYASMYFPGTALYYAVPVRLGLPPWLFAIALSGLGVALMYLAATRLLDGLYGLLAALMLLAISQYRAWATGLMSHPVLMVLALAMFLSAMRWRDTRKLRWAAAAGFCAGWALITRPLDALCCIAPLGIMLLWDLRAQSWRARIVTALTTAAAAFPFVLLQLVQNYGITGRLLTTPVHQSIQNLWPEMAMGWRPADGVLRPTPREGRRLIQFQQFYDEFVWPTVQSHRQTPAREIVQDRLLSSVRHSLPSKMLIVLMPAALVGVWDRRRWALWGAAPLFIAAYMFFPFYLFHYVLVIAPMMILTPLVGAWSVRRAAGREGRWVELFALTLIALLSVKMLPWFNGGRLDQFHRMLTLRDVNAKLAALPAGERALVFFVYHQDVKDLWHEEPVYTLDAPTPDQARIVRAHDLGARNAELIGYYARIQPDRRVYSYDLETRELKQLGPVTELAK